MVSPSLTEIPQEYTFEGVYEEIKHNLFWLLRMQGITHINQMRRYLAKDDYRKTIVVILPVTEHEYHEIAIHVSERRWTTTQHRYEEHFRAAVNSARRFFKGIKRRNIKNRTYFLGCLSYSNRIKPVGRRRGSMRQESAFSFPLKDSDWIKEIGKRLMVLYYRRVKTAKQSSKIKPYGNFKDFLDSLNNIIHYLATSFIGTESVEESIMFARRAASA